MSEGEDFRNSVTDFIDNYGSTVKIFDRDPHEGSYGDYEPGKDYEGTGTTIKAIPSNYLKTRAGEDMGVVLTGEVMLVVKFDATIDKDDKVEYKESNYKVEEIKTVIMQDVIIAKRIKLSRRLD